MLPSGDPVQLTHDDLNKMSPAFSPDGSRIAYAGVTAGNWDTWHVPVLGGEPRRWLPNASGLVWIGESKLLFSEIKDPPFHMATVTAEESRAGSRDIYLPPQEGDLRIVDESAEDYLYDSSRFVAIEVPEALERAILRKAS